MKAYQCILVCILLLVACGCTKSGEEKPAEKSSVRKTIEDGVDATITHKTQIEAYLRTKKKLDALNSRNKEMLKELEGMEEPAKGDD